MSRGYLPIRLRKAQYCEWWPEHIWACTNPILSSFPVRAARGSRAYLWTFGNSYLALIYWINLTPSADVSRLKASSVPAGRGGVKAPAECGRTVGLNQRPAREVMTHRGREVEVWGQKGFFSLHRRHLGNVCTHTGFVPSCLCSEGTQEIQNEQNKTGRGMESLAEAKNFPRPLRPWVLGIWPRGLRVLVLAALDCPSQPKKRKLCAGYKTNFICCNPTDWVTKTSIHLHIYFKHLFNGRHFAKAKWLAWLPACWVVGGGNRNKQLQAVGTEEWKQGSRGSASTLPRLCFWAESTKWTKSGHEAEGTACTFSWTRSPVGLLGLGGNMSQPSQHWRPGEARQETDDAGPRLDSYRRGGATHGI